MGETIVGYLVGEARIYHPECLVPTHDANGTVFFVKHIHERADLPQGVRARCVRCGDALFPRAKRSPAKRAGSGQKENV